MITNHSLTQCDFCEIALQQTLNDKKINDRTVYSVKIKSSDDKIINGDFCSLECVVFACKKDSIFSATPIFSHRQKALKDLLTKLEERENAVYQKHGVVLPKLKKEQNEIDNQIIKIEQEKIPEVYESN